MKNKCLGCFWQRDCEDKQNKEKYDYDCWKYRSKNQKYSFSESSNRDDTENLHKR